MSSRRRAFNRDRSRDTRYDNSYFSQELSVSSRREISLSPSHATPQRRFAASRQPLLALPIFFITFLISYPPASVTVIQIPIVIYVDINGNPPGLSRLAARSPPSRRLKDAATPVAVPPPSYLPLPLPFPRPRVQILCFIESELSLLLLASRRLSPFPSPPSPSSSYAGRLLALLAPLPLLVTGFTVADQATGIGSGVNASRAAPRRAGVPL